MTASTYDVDVDIESKMLPSILTVKSHFEFKRYCRVVWDGRTDKAATICSPVEGHKKPTWCSR